MDTDSPAPKRRRTSSNSSIASSGEGSLSRHRSQRSPSVESRRPQQRRESRSGSRSESHQEDRRRKSWQADSGSQGSHGSGDEISSNEEGTPRSRSCSTDSLPLRPQLVLTPTPPPSSSKHLKFKPIPDGTLRSHARGITCVCFSPSAEFLASAAADATVHIHSTAQPFPHLKTLTGHLAGINVLAWSPDGRTIASGSDDKSIRLWDVAAGKAHPVPLLGHHNYVYSLAFSPKGNMLVSGSYDEAVFLWDIRPTGGIVMRSLPAHSDPVSGVDFLRDGTMVCSCAGDGLIRIWDTMTGQCLKTLVDEDRKPVASVQWTANGKFVLAWTLDGCVRLWDYREGRCVKTYQGHINHQYSLSGTMGTYALAGKREAFVASGSENGEVLAWDVSTKEVLWRDKGHSKAVLSLDFQRGRDGKGMLVSAGLDRTIRFWEECDEVDANADAANEQPVLVDGDAYVNAADENVKRLRLDERDEDEAIDTVETETEAEDTGDRR